MIQKEQDTAIGHMTLKFSECLAPCNILRTAEHICSSSRLIYNVQVLILPNTTATETWKRKHEEMKMVVENVLLADGALFSQSIPIFPQTRKRPRIHPLYLE